MPKFNLRKPDPNVTDDPFKFTSLSIEAYEQDRALRHERLQKFNERMKKSRKIKVFLTDGLLAKGLTRMSKNITMKPPKKKKLAPLRNSSEA